MNVQQQALNLIKENGGTATRGQIAQLTEFIRPNANAQYANTLCWHLYDRGFAKWTLKHKQSEKEKDEMQITPLGRKYLKDRKATFKPRANAKSATAVAIEKISEKKEPTPIEKLIRGSIIRDLLLSRFDQLSASERCGLVEIYNIIESNTKTQQQ